jgi:hypothetical protein
VKAHHDPAKACYRSPWQKGGSHSCQQCCYDDKGHLIKHGSGAGTPDYFCVDYPSVEPSPRFHAAWDVVPFTECGWNWYHDAGWKPNQGCDANKGVVKKRR